MTFVTTFNCNTVDNIYVNNMQASGIPEWAHSPCKQIWF